MNIKAIASGPRAAALVTVLVTGLLGGSAVAGAARDAALDAAIAAAMARAPIPGMIVGIWQDGQDPYVRAVGVRDTATAQPMTTDLHMRIGSVTKSFTVTSILMLADQGKLNLDDPIDRHYKGVPGGHQITLRHLAGMRSGLYNYADTVFPMHVRNPHRRWPPRELLAHAFRSSRGLNPPLQFTPGSEFDYSNTNTVLLGEVVRRVSGQSIESFIEQHILIPSGLTHTFYPRAAIPTVQDRSRRWAAQMPSPHSQGYYELPDRTLVDATDWSPTWGAAAGQMISNLDDMRVWTRDFALGKLISPAMKHERDTFQDAPPEGVGARYGLAIENQNGWLGHNGNTRSYMTFPYYLPDEKITLVVLLNAGSLRMIVAVWTMMQDITRIISPNNPWPDLPPVGDPTE
jgi:D-alanyl-D-alanine carboxypeptidase